MQRLIRATGFLFVATLVAVSSTPAFAAPSTMLLEGAMTSNAGGAAADGDYNMTFSLWDSASGGKQLWKEGPVLLKVTSGRFRYALGKTKAIDAKAFAGKSFLQVTIGTNPPLTRTPLHSVAYALQASVAGSLSCTGCLKGTHIAAGSVSPAQVGFAYAGAADGIKGGAAKKAMDLSCTGCVKTKHLAFDGDVDLKGNGLTAGKITAKGNITSSGALIGNKATINGDGAFSGSVAAKQFIGDGSKLTGIKTPAGSCTKAGQVVKGINADGSLKCVDALDPNALPKDGLNEISNNLLHNQFVDAFSSPKTVAIVDNSPNGVISQIDFPDIGIAQKFEVRVQIKNSDVTGLSVFLLPPSAPTLPKDRSTIVQGYPKSMTLKSAYKHYHLHKHTGTKGKALDAIYPTKVKPASGDLTEWIGKNPKGKWTLFVVDGSFKDNKIDGEIVKWTITIQTLSNKKVRLSGNLVLDGDIIGKGGSNVPLKDAKTQAKLWAELAGNNWKQCTWFKMNNGTDVGKVAECTFNKKYDGTSLLIKWDGTLRSAHNCNACCKRWYFMIDGSECSSPGRIDGNRYTWIASGHRTDFHHQGHIEGYCKRTFAKSTIPKGTRKIQFYISNCYGYGNNDGYTGWNSTSRIMITEVPPGQ